MTNAWIISVLKAKINMNVKKNLLQLKNITFGIKISIKKIRSSLSAVEEVINKLKITLSVIKN